MLFNSFVFLLAFLPAALVIYRIADPHPALRTWTLIVLSFVFYGYGYPWFVTLLAGSILVNWLAAGWYGAVRHPAIIAAAIVANLAVLAVFKYADFFADNIAAVLGVSVGHLGLALPLGISFFTFHHIMYLVDLRRGRAPLYPLDRYALYICFFPQAIAGPLARWSQVMHQFGREVFVAGWESRWALGIATIVIGLVEKTLLGDPLGQILDPIYARAVVGPVRDGTAWFAPAFAFQVFFDFAGYSDIAIGLGLLFGVELPRNFNAPFRATSIQDFWQRWHMTLMLFLRDYVFLPLSELRWGGRRRVAQHFAAIVVTMVLCGLWHGAGWTFVLWGTLQGCALVFAAIWRRHMPSPPALVGWVLTLVFVLMSSILFRAGTLDAAWHIVQGFAVPPALSALSRPGVFFTCALVALIMPASQDIATRLVQRPRFASAAGLALTSVAILLEIGNHQSYSFIYFQF